MPMLHAGKDTVSNLEGIVPGPSAADTGVPRYGTAGHQLPQDSAVGGGARSSCEALGKPKKHLHGLGMQSAPAADSKWQVLDPSSLELASMRLHADDDDDDNNDDNDDNDDDDDDDDEFVRCSEKEGKSHNSNKSNYSWMHMSR